MGRQVFQAMVVMGKNHATRASFCETLAAAFEAGAAATTERRREVERLAGVLPWGEEWPEERVQQDPIPRCPHCGTRCRPEVLWFDESYNELHYRYESAVAAAEAAAEPREGMLNLPAKSGAALPALLSALKALHA